MSVAEKAVKRYGDDARVVGNLAIIENTHCAGSVKEFLDGVEKDAVDGYEVISTVACLVRRPAFKVKREDFFTHAGHVFMLHPLLDLDLMKPVVRVRVIKYVLKTHAYDAEDMAFADSSDENERDFYDSHNVCVILLEDNAGDCIGIASCGTIEGNKKYVPERKMDYTLDQFMVRAVDTDGDF